MQGDLSTSVLETFVELTYGHPDDHSVFIGLLFPEVLMLLVILHDPGDSCLAAAIEEASSWQHTPSRESRGISIQLLVE